MVYDASDVYKEYISDFQRITGQKKCLVEIPEGDRFAFTFKSDTPVEKMFEVLAIFIQSPFSGLRIRQNKVNYTPDEFVDELLNRGHDFYEWWYDIEK